VGQIWVGGVELGQDRPRVGDLPDGAGQRRQRADELQGLLRSQRGQDPLHQVGGFSEVLAREVGPLGIKVTVLEPGGMATDWAGSSMQVPPVSEPYQATVGAMARVHDDLGSSAALGDPAKVAQVVLAVAGMDEPPLRLILGSEAYAYATAAARARAESDAAWHDLTVSTDRDDATEAERDPLAAARG